MNNAPNCWVTGAQIRVIITKIKYRKKILSYLNGWGTG